MTTLYHGLYVSVPSPLTGVGRRELDFGPSFYVTNLHEQAERWARRVGVIRAADQQWLDFVVSSRRGEEPWREYDIIEGGVANDQVIDTVEDYYAGRITAEQAIGQLRFAKPTHQMCIRRQDIVDLCLHFVSTETVAEEGGAQ